jgi:triosephosphate isomerase
MFLFGTNLKMHQTPQHTRDYASQLARLLRDVPYREKATIWIVPPFTSLATVADLCAAHGFVLGAQTMHWADEGAYTGEISPVMLKACGAAFVMLGHAERRMQFGETDELLNKKVLAAARHGLTAMLCVGEPARIQQAGAGDAYVAQQLRVALSGLALAAEEATPLKGGLIVLYEPLWSVGMGGTAADPAYVAAAMGNIGDVLRQLFDARGERVPILYGGSVDAENCADYARLPQASGMGLGRAGWRPESLVQVLSRALDARYALGHRHHGGHTEHTALNIHGDVP